MTELTKGTISGGNKWLTWSEYLAKVEEAGGNPKELTGTHVITHIFPPARFPSATLVFWVDELGGVKKSIPPQQWAAIAPLFTPGKAVKGFTLYINFDGEGGYSILRDDTPTAIYTPTPAGGWELA